MDKVAAALEQGGLRRAVSRAIAEEHRLQIEVWDDAEDPRLSTWTRRLSERLPTDARWQKELEQQPNLASCLAALQDVHNLDSALGDPDLMETAYWALTLFARDPEVNWMASALPLHLERIDALRTMGFSVAPPLFVFDRTVPGAAEYDAFLASILDSGVLRRPEVTVRALGVLLDVGRSIRLRLQVEPALRKTLRGHLPEIRAYFGLNLERVEDLEIAPYLIDLAGIPGGLDLLSRRGHAVTEILFERGLAEGMRPRVARLLVNIPSDCVIGLWWAAPHSGQLETLLDRPTDPSVLFASLTKLGRAGDPAGELDYLIGLSLSAYEEECGPPPPAYLSMIPLYDVYSVSKRAIRGQRVSGADLAFAALDIALSAVPVAKGAAKAVKAVGKALRAAKAASAASSGIRDLAKMGLNSGKARFAKSLEGLRASVSSPATLLKGAVSNADDFVELASFGLRSSGQGGTAVLMDAGRRGLGLLFGKGCAAQGVKGNVKTYLSLALGLTPQGKSKLWFLRELGDNARLGNLVLDLSSAGEWGYAAYRDSDFASVRVLTPTWIEQLVGPGE